MAFSENRVVKYNNKKGATLSLARVTSFTGIINLVTFLFVFSIIFNNKISNSQYFQLSNIILHNNVINPIVNYTYSGINLIANVISFSKLNQENLRLKFELQNTLNVNKQLEILKNENLILQNALNLKISTPSSSFKAKIISSYSPDSDKKSIISVGANQNAKLNQIVMKNGYLFGRIVDVSPNHSQVLLINSHNSRIPIKSSSNNVKAILVGDIDEIAYLNHVTDYKKIKVGELILTSGDGKFYPSDLPIGKVIKIQNNSVFVRMEHILHANEYVDILDPV